MSDNNPPMNTPTQEQLNQILAEHRLWIESNCSKGKRANLEGANLLRANLQGATMPEPLVRAGEVWLHNGKPFLVLKETEEEIELLGANGTLTKVPVWYKWTHLAPTKSKAQ